MNGILNDSLASTLQHRFLERFPASSHPQTCFDWLEGCLAESKEAGLRVVQLTAFNPEDVILSAHLAETKTDTPALFLQTGKHFPDTLRYARDVARRYGFERQITYLYPDETIEQNIDAAGTLWQTQVNRCCWLRKTAPLEKRLTSDGYGVLLVGLRKDQTPERVDMSPVQIDDKGRLKLSPLFHWSKEERDRYMQEKCLPAHPLYRLGYPSIGCAPCTTPVFLGENDRAGRWRHTRVNAQDGTAAAGKTECGLHVETN